MARPFRDRGALKQWELQFGPNMTPMVDVVMVILIFFMAGTAFIGREWFLRAAIPVEGAPPPGEARPVRLDLMLKMESGRTVVRATPEGEAVEVAVAVDERIDDAVRDLVRGAGAAGAGEVIVLIRPEADVAYRDVVRVQEACARAGVERVGLGEP